VNIQEYISSGIVESYVLGLVSADERREFESMCNRYPEILRARIAFEEALEKTAIQNAIEPPAYLEEEILNEIQSGTKDVSLHSSTLRKMRLLRVAIAACLILLAGSLYWNISLYNKNKNAQANLDISEQTLAQMEADAKAIQNSSIIMARMDGTPVSPQSFTTVYWDTTSHDVYLMINNLPKPASDQQYQLWALLNGKPIDMGVVEISEKPLQLYRMKNAQSAQAFAITLEKRGGSPIPSMDKMYVMGKL
jgi:anti-sigma-K factor RskA